jgi:hypothetical protein
MKLTNDTYLILLGTRNFTERYYRDQTGWLKVSARGRRFRMTAEQVLNHLLPALAGIKPNLSLQVEHHAPPLQNENCCPTACWLDNALDLGSTCRRMKVAKSTPKPAVKVARMPKRTKALQAETINIRKVQAPAKATEAPQKKKRKISPAGRAAMAAAARARWARVRAAKSAKLKNKAKK